jgi:undecaprenyl-diphosphatase
LTVASAPRVRILTAKQRRVVLWLGAAAALAFVALALAPESPQLGGVDVTVRALVKQAQRPELDGPMRLLSFVGSGTVIFPAAALGLAIIWTRYRRLALLLAAAAVTAGTISTLVKWLIDRPRPRLGPYSFPSGHTVSIVVFSGLFIYVLWAFGLPRPARRAAIATGVVATVGVALSRVYLGAHWFTDVAGGLAGGLAFVLFVVLYLDQEAYRAQPDSR